jgi:hypothetical protein
MLFNVAVSVTMCHLEAGMDLDEFREAVCVLHQILLGLSSQEG